MHAHKQADATEQVSGHSEWVVCGSRKVILGEEIKNKGVVGRSLREKVSARQEAEES